VNRVEWPGCPLPYESVNFLLLCHCEDECNEDEAIQSKPLNLLDCRVGLTRCNDETMQS
jgi:hypothetical protein